MKAGTLIWIRIILYTLWALAGAWCTAMAGVKWADMGWEAQSCLVGGILLSWTGTMMAFFDKSLWQYAADKLTNGNGQPKPPLADSTMKTITIIAFIGALALCGCMTSKTTTVTPGGVTNTVVTVNQANLALDCGVIQGITAGAVSVIVAKEPSSVPILKDAALSLDAALNGANTNTTAKVLTLLGENNNPVLAAEVTSLLGTVSSLEQQLLVKYGQKVGGQITLAITRAIYGGIEIGLAGK
ncbi:MAG: hypothetical protein ABFD89_06665 [Bryobacteraceae bacterium]